jgi:hypothetical protein
LILAGLGVLIYFSCFAGNAKKINPSTIAQDNNSLNIGEGTTTYQVKNINGEPNSNQMWSSPYISNIGGQYGVYVVYAKTAQGTVAFYVDIYGADTTHDAEFYTIGSASEIDDATPGSLYS